MSRVIEQNAAGATNVGLAAGNVLAGTGLGLAAVGLMTGLAPLRALAVLMLGIGAWMIWVGLRQRRKDALVGAASLRLSRNKIRPGDRVEARLTAPLAEGVEVVRVAAQLVETGTKIRRNRGSTDVAHSRHILRTVDAEEVRLSSAVGELAADMVLVVPTADHDVPSTYDEMWSVTVTVHLVSAEHVTKAFAYRIR